jgi:hypothetical protein
VGFVPVRSVISSVVLVLLALVLHRVWPSQAIEALRNDPEVVLRAPWQAEPPPEQPASPVAAPAPRPAVPPPGALRVLFVGNSHTFMNQMPALIAELAAAAPGARPFFFRMEAPGGAKLIEHVQNGRVQVLLAEQAFDFVVLQEQQQWPSFAQSQRQREFEAPAITLDVMVRAAGAKTLLFMTWARREGDRPNRVDDTYEQMQARVHEGYRDAARALDVPVVGVGLVWREVVRTHPDLALWQPDGSHASLAGSYLAACVFFKAMYGRSPEGNAYTAGLPDEDARRLQQVAAAAKALYAPSEL